MGALGKKFCLILDIDKVLSADEVLAVTESTAGKETSDATVINAPAKAANRIGTGRIGERRIRCGRFSSD